MAFIPQNTNSFKTFRVLNIAVMVWVLRQCLLFYVFGWTLTHYGWLTLFLRDLIILYTCIMYILGRYEMTI